MNPTDSMRVVPEQVERAYGQVLLRGNTDAIPETVFEAIKFTSPGETAALILGDPWRLYAEREIPIPREYLGDSHMIYYQTIILSNDENVLLICRTKTFDDCRNRRTGPNVQTWDGLTPLQRSNAILSALYASLMGVGPDGAFLALAQAVDFYTFGEDPTSWLAAANLLRTPPASPIPRPADDLMDTALFLSRIGNPRFAALYKP